MTEAWRAVVGYEGLYEVSDNGRVRSLDRIVVRQGVKQPRRGKVLADGATAQGYRIVVLCRGAQRKTRKIHQLVLEAFRGRRPKGLVTRHLNGKHDDNRLHNLVWGSPAENTSDAISHGTRFKAIGEYHGMSKLTAQRVQAIRRMVLNGERGIDIAKAYGVSPSTISLIKRGKIWLCV